ncbi:hypothetical protein ACOMHN_052171 [Nucella lapillus]
MGKVSKNMSWRREEWLASSLRVKDCADHPPADGPLHPQHRPCLSRPLPATRASRPLTPLAPRDSGSPPTTTCATGSATVNTAGSVAAGTGGVGGGSRCSASRVATSCRFNVCLHERRQLMTSPLTRENGGGGGGGGSFTSCQRCARFTHQPHRHHHHYHHHRCSQLRPSYHHPQQHVVFGRERKWSLFHSI